MVPTWVLVSCNGVILSPRVPVNLSEQGMTKIISSHPRFSVCRQQSSTLHHPVLPRLLHHDEQWMMQSLSLLPALNRPWMVLDVSTRHAESTQCFCMSSLTGVPEGVQNCTSTTPHSSPVLVCHTSQNRPTHVARRSTLAMPFLGVLKSTTATVAGAPTEKQLFNNCWH